MDFDVAPVLIIGGIAVLGGFAFLFGLVGRDLAPASGPASPPRWLLAGGLGIGMVAFSIKLVVIAVISHGGPAHRQPTRSADEAAPVMPAPSEMPPSPLWMALPAVAPAPPDNPTTPAKIALGRRLFFETQLSADGTISCASCHDLKRAGADSRPLSLGVGGAIGARNAPTVYNAAFQKRLFWDGRARSLEEQALGPMLNPVEMALPNREAIEARLAALPEYAPLFAAAFGDRAITALRAAQAIAAFERTLVTPDSPYDRFVHGEASALNAGQLKGMALFQEVGCIRCHGGPNFSQASVFSDDAGLRRFPAVENSTLDPYDLRRDKGASTGERGLWRIPSLRNVALTAPYFHNGSVPALREAVRIMAASQCNAALADDARAGRSITWDSANASLGITDRRVLTAGDIDDIVAFLTALTSERLARQVAAP